MLVKDEKKRVKNKSKIHDHDFFNNAKKVVGEKRFNKSIQIGHEQASEIRLKMAGEFIGKMQIDLVECLGLKFLKLKREKI